ALQVLPSFPTRRSSDLGRRLQSIIHFPVPRFQERLKLWKQSFSIHTVFAENVNLDAISEKYEMAGGSINNVAQYASLMALHRNRSEEHTSELQSPDHLV